MHSELHKSLKLLDLSVMADLHKYKVQAEA